MIEEPTRAELIAKVTNIFAQAQGPEPTILSEEEIDTDWCIQAVVYIRVKDCDKFIPEEEWECIATYDGSSIEEVPNNAQAIVEYILEWPSIQSWLEDEDVYICCIPYGVDVGQYENYPKMILESGSNYNPFALCS